MELNLEGIFYPYRQHVRSALGIERTLASLRYASLFIESCTKGATQDLYQIAKIANRVALVDPSKGEHCDYHQCQHRNA